LHQVLSTQPIASLTRPTFEGSDFDALRLGLIGLVQTGKSRATGLAHQPTMFDRRTHSRLTNP